MKRNICSILAAFCLAVMLPLFSNAQCTIDSSFTAPGIYPSDTLPDLLENSPYSFVVQFVFPPDTMLGPLTVPFDSFFLSTVVGLPDSISWQCDQFANGCAYYTTPNQLTRGCATVMGTPIAPNPAYPGYDSIVVEGVAWTTISPFPPVPNNVDIPIYYRIVPDVSVDEALEDRLDLAISPNPATDRTTISFDLPHAMRVKVDVLDLFGRELSGLCDRYMNPGTQAVEFEAGELPRGVYLLRMELEEGKGRVVKRVLLR